MNVRNCETEFVKNDVNRTKLKKKQVAGTEPDPQNDQTYFT